MTAPWHRQAWAQFVAARQQGRLGHGIAIRAPGDFFKRDLGIAMGAALLCRTPSASGAACGACKNCLLFAAGTHPDWIEIAPEESAVIKIDQIRALSERLSKRPQIGDCQVALLHPADRMNVPAANALLKTLEEPSADSYLILSCDRYERLPATIRSRCQTLEIRGAVEPDWAPALAELANVDIAKASTALLLAGDDPQAALAVAQPDELGARASIAESLIALANGRTAPAAVAQSAGRDIGTWLDRFAALLRLALRPGATMPPFASFADLTSRLEMSRLFALQRELGRARSLLGSGMREDLLLYELCCQWRDAARG